MYSVSVIYDFTIVLSQAAHAFMFSPEMSTSLGLTRIMLAICVILNSLQLRKVADIYLGSASTAIGLQNYRPPTLGHLLWKNFDSCSIRGLMNLEIICAICMMLGFYPQFFAIVIYLIVYSYHSHNPYITNGGHAQLRTMILLLSLSPCGTALSLDCLIHNKPILGTMIEPWSIRIMQIFIALVYYKSATNKLVTSYDWWNGKMLSYALNGTNFSRVSTRVPKWLCVLGCYYTLIAQNLFIYLVWFKETRYYVLTMLILLHTAMVFTMLLGYFPLIAISCLSIFIDPDDLHNLLSKLL
jgi:uncharacterized membrane protein YphA (DoxX/SURF4 family)